MRPVFEIEPEFWREGAVCVAHPEVDFFTDDTSQVAQAKALCVACPVQDECLIFAVETNQPDGIWGGHTAKERVKLRRRWLEAFRRAS